MSQDQIAKLMAISGRLPATAPVEPTLGGMDDGVRQPSAPPPLLGSEAIQLSVGAAEKPAAPDEPPTRRFFIVDDQRTKRLRLHVHCSLLLSLQGNANDYLGTPTLAPGNHETIVRTLIERFQTLPRDAQAEPR